MASMSDGLDNIFDMGGYGMFVWPAYALVAALLVWLLIVRIGRLRRRENELARLEQVRQSGRNNSAAPPSHSSLSPSSAKERA
jgi:heme exporter protein D